MGGQSSKTRKLTVENEDPTSVIKVSEDVVERIKGKQTVRQTSEQAPAWPAAPGQQAAPGIIGQPIYLYEPSLTTLQLRQAKVAELKKNDEYWQNRIKILEKNQKKINEIMDQEYCKAVDELKCSESPIVKYPVPCKETKQAVVECYKSYPNEPMKCSKLVQAFQECVDLKRTAIVTNRG